MLAYRGMFSTSVANQRSSAALTYFAAGSAEQLNATPACLPVSGWD